MNVDGVESMLIKAAQSTSPIPGGMTRGSPGYAYDVVGIKNSNGSFLALAATSAARGCEAAICNEGHNEFTQVCK